MRPKRQCRPAWPAPVAVALLVGCGPSGSQSPPTAAPAVTSAPPPTQTESSAPEQAVVEPIRFALAWPAGEAHVSRQMYKRRPETTLDRTFLSEWTMRVEKVDGGTRIVGEDYQNIAFDGRVGSAFEVDPPEGFISEITVDDGGGIVSMGGLDQLEDVLQAQEDFKAQAGAPRGWKAKKLVIAFSEDAALERTQRNSWNALGGDLVGREFVPGELEVRETKGVHPLDPEVQTTMRTQTRLTTDVACGEGGPETCIRFEATAEPEDPRALSQRIAESLKQGKEEVDGLEIVFETRRVLVLDPATMRPFVAEQHKVFSLRVRRGEEEEETSVEQGVELRFAWR